MLPHSIGMDLVLIMSTEPKEKAGVLLLSVSLNTTLSQSNLINTRPLSMQHGRS